MGGGTIGDWGFASPSYVVKTKRNPVCYTFKHLNVGYEMALTHLCQSDNDWT